MKVWKRVFLSLLCLFSCWPIPISQADQPTQEHKQVLPFYGEFFSSEDAFPASPIFPINPVPSLSEQPLGADVFPQLDPLAISPQEEQGKVGPALGEVKRITAVLHPATSHILVSPGGATVQSVYGQVGDTVRSGQVLAKLRDDKIGCETGLAQGVLHTLYEDLEVLATLYPKERTLWQAQQEVLKEAKAKLEAGETVYTLTAPADGFIMAIPVVQGQAIAAGATVMELAGTGPLRVACMVPSKYTRWIKKGGLLDIEIAETGKVYLAKIDRVAAQIDPATQMFEVWAVMEGTPEDVLPGMSGFARIVVSGE